jgi:hypothetical protein
MDDAFAVSRMPEIGLSGSMWRGPETKRWQTYTGTKPETADTDKASLHATAPAPDPTRGRSTRSWLSETAGPLTKEAHRLVPLLPCSPGSAPSSKGVTRPTAAHGPSDRASRVAGLPRQVVAPGVRATTRFRPRRFAS